MSVGAAPVCAATFLPLTVAVQAALGVPLRVAPLRRRHPQRMLVAFLGQARAFADVVASLRPVAAAHALNLEYSVIGDYGPEVTFYADDQDVYLDIITSKHSTVKVTLYVW